MKVIKVRKQDDIVYDIQGQIQDFVDKFKRQTRKIGFVDFEFYVDSGRCVAYIWFEKSREMTPDKLYGVGNLLNKFVRDIEDARIFIQKQLDTK